MLFEHPLKHTTLVMQGREILQSTVDLVQNTLNLEVRPLSLFIAMQSSHAPSYLIIVFFCRGQVIYGDTDSIMIYSGLDDDVKSKGIARKVIQEVT